MSNPMPAEPNESTFQAALGPDPGPRPVAKPRPQPRPRAAQPSVRDKRVAGRLRARKVRRLIRHVEPWSVLKVSLVFYFCLWVIFLLAGTILWSVARSTGYVDNVESFLEELFALKSFEFNADQIFQASAMGGLVLVVALSGFTVLLAVLFNLISDLMGGVRVTVVEEETARVRPRRTAPRRVQVQQSPSGAPQIGNTSPQPGPPTRNPTPVAPAATAQVAVTTADQGGE